MASQQLLIAGGGIGGFAAALAAVRAGWDVRLFERASQFAEVGAGIQLGPNVTRILHAWGLQEALREVAAFPVRLQVRNAASGQELGVLPLGSRMQERYGAPYVAIHRADFHGLLADAAAGVANVHLNLDHGIVDFHDDGRVVTVRGSHGPQVEGDALIGADGLWSRVREKLLADGHPRATGHLAYRAMLRQSALPERLRSDQVTAWLGPGLHLVQYPVRAGEWMNVVAIVHGQAPVGAQDWDHEAHAADLRRVMGGTCSKLQDLIAAVGESTVNDHPWRLWPLADRPPLTGAGQMARGLVGLLGDAAHPMRPYLAQGAGMAVEDAAELGYAL